uniref:Uncharacterized protein n=1 Tax=Marmota marmota marmota TaxID=9994 RepID=A0A8C5ZI12_MARMA
VSFFYQWQRTFTQQDLEILDAQIKKTHWENLKNKKQEDPPEDQHPPHGRSLQKEEGAPGTENRAKETGEQAPEEGPSPSKTEPQKDAKAMGLSWELSPPISKSFPVQDVSLPGIPLWSTGLTRALSDMKVEKILAGRKECRSRFGEVNVHKRCQSGQVFSPFQALATIEMRRLVFPRDVPMSSDAQRVGPSSLKDIRLQDLPLSSTELGLGKDDKPHEREKPVNHTKTPLFPQIVKATKYNDMK